MAGAGVRSFAKFRGQMPRIATTRITSWQTALKWTADCQVFAPESIRSKKKTSVRSTFHVGAGMKNVGILIRDEKMLGSGIRDKTSRIHNTAPCQIQIFLRDWLNKLCSDWT
jgi:hypothetical protein